MAEFFLNLYFKIRVSKNPPLKTYVFSVVRVSATRWPATMTIGGWWPTRSHFEDIFSQVAEKCG